MAIAVSKLVELVSEEQPPEVRGSALTVLGQLGERDNAVNAAILEALGDEDPEVRLRAVRAAGQLRVDKALPQLAETLRAGGPVGEAAAESAAQIGAKGTKMLREPVGHVAPRLRRHIAAAITPSAPPR